MELLIGVIIGIASTFSSQWLWHKYTKREAKKSRLPIVVVNRYGYGDTIYFELVNIGNDDIKDLEVHIKWMQDGKLESRNLKRFFEPVDNPVMDSAKAIEYLSINEKVRVADIPQLSDDGIVKVIIGGIGVTSGKRLNQVSEQKVNTPIRVRHL